MKLALKVVELFTMQSQQARAGKRKGYRRGKGEEKRKENRKEKGEDKRKENRRGKKREKQGKLEREGEEKGREVGGKKERT